MIARIIRACCLLLLLAAAAYPNSVVAPGRKFVFPSDHGAHPDYRTEWWYVTGTAHADDGREIGFQITFFRVKSGGDPANPSAFAARQILFAHVAVSDGRAGRLLADSRAARAGFGIAGAKLNDSEVTIRDWTLVRVTDGIWRTRVAAHGFALNLILRPTQPPLLQGENGYSRKGPNPAEASYYYSVPQMEVRGQITIGGTAHTVTGKAWLDREWSSNYLNPVAVGWDWTGLNFDDGGALMLFRIRRADGTNLWTGGSYRDRTGRVTVMAPRDVIFQTVRRWRSARTGAVYPVAQAITVRLPTGVRTLNLTPLFDDQEIDARRNGLPVYWEGFVKTPGGAGYLELTGYVAPLKM